MRVDRSFETTQAEVTDASADLSSVQDHRSGVIAWLIAIPFVILPLIYIGRMLYLAWRLFYWAFLSKRPDEDWPFR